MKITYTLDDEQDTRDLIKRMSTIDDLYSFLWELDMGIRYLLRSEKVDCLCDICYPDRENHQSNPETVQSLCEKNKILINRLEIIRSKLGPFLENYT